MKKLIGILGIAMIVMAMFFNSNTMNSSNGDLNLASILNLNSANAECTSGCSAFMPSAKLCPDQKKYMTECVGTGSGCNPSQC